MRSHRPPTERDRDCKQVRKTLVESRSGVLEQTHLDNCSECLEFSSRLDIAIEIMREPRTEITPDSGFARRTAAAIAGAQASSLESNIGWSWAAGRLAPVAVALALVLGGWCWVATAPPSEVLASSSSADLLTWALGTDQPAAPGELTE